MSVDESVRSLSMDYLNLLINGQAFSDVSFCVEGRVVPAHRCILAARSLFFRRFFSDPSAAASQPPPVIPVTSVSYEVFMLMLQFLYTGQVSVLPQKHEPRPNCSDRSCPHSHCSSAVDLALDTLSVARSFGVDQLASLTQKQLSIMVEKASVDDVMRVLLASRKQETQPLWFTCSHLVAKSGLPAEILAKHLPIDVVASIEDLRLKSTRRHHDHQQSHHHPYHLHDLAELEEHKIRRMRRALDSSDVELVKMMVMGEGLSLDAALALHYAVQSSTREVVKALLELGAADVNYPAGPAGKTPLHLAAEMVSPDMVAVLLDHHADPTARTVEGVTPLDVLRGLTSDFLFKGAIPGLAHVEPNKLRLCLELVQSAAMVILREEGNDNNNNNNNDGGEQNSVSPGSSGNMGGLNVDSRMVYLHLGGRVGSGQAGEDESAPSNMGRSPHW